MGNLVYKTEEEIYNNKNKGEKVNNNKKKKKSKFLKKLVITLLILFLLGCSSIAFLLYGPYPGFREWLITTAMTTMTHQYLATWFYDDATIQDVLSRNSVVEVDENTNPDLLTIVTEQEEEKVEYANEYERQILERDSKDQVYKIIQIEGKKYSGYMAIIYDPSRIKTVVTKKLGRCGQYLKTMAEENDALIAINGGGFVDPNFNSNGANPLGITFSGGKLITQNVYKGSGGLIGFTEDNKLVLGKMTVKQAQDLKVRDGVTFGPFLIVNGKSSEVLGNGGWGTAPRTAIGQRKDGIVLFLVIDGRRIGKPGADMDDLIEIMENYGAYNAANLDGGTSTVLYANGKIINDPIDSTGAHKTRFISTGFIVTKDESEDKDVITDSTTESIIEDAINKATSTKTNSTKNTTNTKSNTTTNSTKNTTSIKNNTTTNSTKNTSTNKTNTSKNTTTNKSTSTKTNTNKR